MAIGERIQSIIRPSAGSERQGWPVASRPFDLTALVLAAWVILGAAVDINAHNHGEVDESFFTPWHLLLYSGVLANTLLLLVTQYRNVGRGYPLLRALPQGYRVALAGGPIFLLGGVFDMFWHEAFGFEANLEALISPAHLWLAASGALLAIGPLRAAWIRAEAQRGWGQLFPAISSAMLLLFVYILFTEFSNAMYQPDRFVLANGGEEYSIAARALDVTLISSVLIPAALISGTLLLLLRRWTLPFGAVTYLLTGASLIGLYLRLEWTMEYWPVLLAAPIAGLAGDWLLRRGQQQGARPGVTDLRRVVTVVPLLYFLAYFLILMGVAAGGIRWPIHMWLGASVMAGFIGLSMSYVHMPPSLPAEAAGQRAAD